MPNDNLVHIEMLIDSSGSMDSMKSGVITGFNEFVDMHRKLDKIVTLSLSMFSTDAVSYSGHSMKTMYTNPHLIVPKNIFKVHNFNRVENIPKMADRDFQPNGLTPLVEAMSVSIDSLGSDLSAIPEYDRPSKILFVLITDGLENASNLIKYSKAALKERVTHQREKYNWQFTFLGANIDSFAEGGSFGFNMNATANYTPTNLGITRALCAVATSSVNYMSTKDLEASYNLGKTFIGDTEEDDAKSNTSS